MLGRAALIVAPAAEATEVADDPAVLVCEPIDVLPVPVAREDEIPVSVPGTAADPEAALAEVPPGLSMRRSE